MHGVADMTPEETLVEQQNQANRLGLSLEGFLKKLKQGGIKSSFPPPVDTSTGLRHDMSEAACRKRLLERSSGLPT